MVSGVMRSSFCAGLWGQLGLNPGNGWSPRKGALCTPRGTGSCGRRQGLRREGETLALLDCGGIKAQGFLGWHPSWEAPARAALCPCTGNKWPYLE